MEAPASTTSHPEPTSPPQCNARLRVTLSLSEFLELEPSDLLEPTEEMTERDAQVSEADKRKAMASTWELRLGVEEKKEEGSPQ